ncbi:hypothetical protein CWC31_02565 [Pseudoalteromonas ruthenica]|uniref:hypothetical protein n=1 Tax=Pseudoalteromonas ruthenica TaxID=151081 RepID=UPI001108D361|nr:hypothetical protein [Pseudoalteromonas ruthenica]TLX52052.1 hypothetical protein CWC31_02565 [Pseudoalteromonas ruthenica]
MDLADVATTEQERELSRALTYRKPEPPKQSTGRCWNCKEPVEQGRRWCDKRCMTEWEQLHDRNR